MNSEAVDERLLSLRMREKFNNFIIISVHTLTEGKYELIKESFYDKFNQIYQRIPAHDAKIVVGDFNSRIGRGLKTNYREMEPA
jgi:major membrane immunogen (membrane-anchored lipoprotein)